MKSDLEPNTTTDFGFKKVPIEDKTGLVGQVFDSVADNYDIMNDVMSFGVHRLWKRFFITVSGIRMGHKVLDLAGGTGDLSRLIAKRVGVIGQVVLADINSPMLKNGRTRMLDLGILKPLSYTQVNAESLAFEDNCFDYVTIGFGLRNVTQKTRALEEMLRVLKPGGRLLILEFSKVTVSPLRKLYDVYSHKVLPKLGEIIAKDADSYQYLAESIRRHPDQKTLQSMMVEAGFIRCRYQNLTAGIVAIHSGYKA